MSNTKFLGGEALDQQIKTKYILSSKTLEELVDERSINIIARNYRRYREELSLAQIMAMNPGEEEEGGTKTVTTFIHALIENSAKERGVFYVFFQLNKFGIDSQKLVLRYLELSDDSGMSIIDLIKSKNTSGIYEGLYDTIASRFRNIVKTETQQAMLLRVDTHTASVHKSVDQSLVKLARDFFTDKVTTASDRAITVNRDSEWEKKSIVILKYSKTSLIVYFKMRS